MSRIRFQKPGDLSIDLPSGNTRMENSSVDRRKLAQNLIFSLIWPFLSAVIYFLRFPRNRAFLGFAVFCGYAGWVFAPTPGSDADTYAMRILDLQAGLGASFAEPIIRVIAYPIGYLQLDVSFYFVLLGLLYAIFLYLCARLIFQDLPKDYKLPLAGLVFLLAFALYYPVFASLNGRFTLGMWACFAATLFWLRGRWQAALVMAFIGVMIHYGLVLFVLALSLLAISRRLLNLQAPVAYLLVAVAVMLPTGLVLDVGDLVAGIFGGTFADKITDNVAIGVRIIEGDLVRGSGGRVWYFNYFAPILFWALMLSGHYLWLRYINVRRDPLYQLWILIILLWAVSLSVGEVPEATGRMRRIATGLMLLFHAMWFIRQRKGALLVTIFNTVPLLIFFAVGYRIWLHQASLVAFFPLPFAFIGDFWPRAMEFLGFG